MVAFFTPATQGGADADVIRLGLTNADDLTTILPFWL